MGSPYGGDDELEIANAQGMGRAMDAVQRKRNKLVQLAQEGTDDDRQFAVAALKKLSDEYGGFDIATGDKRSTGKTDRAVYDRGTGLGHGPKGYLTEQGQGDPDPSGPLFGGFSGEGEEDPGLLRRMDTSLGTMALNTPKRRQAIAEYDKGFSGGIVTKIAQAVGDDMSPEALAGYAREAPLSPSEKTAMHVAGALTPRSLLRNVAGATEKAMMSVPGVATAAGKAPAVTGAVVGAGSNALSSGAHEGVNALTSGESLNQAGKRFFGAATDAPTLGLGALLGGSAARAKAAREGNRDVRLIEDRGGTVGPTTPGSGAPFDDPLVAQGIDDGGVTEAGIGKTAAASAKGAGEAIQAREAAARQRFQTAEKAAEQSGALDAPTNVTSLYESAVAMTKDPRLPREVRNKINAEIIEDMFSQFGDVADDGSVIMSARDANDLKRKLQYFADFSATGKPEPNFGKLATEAKGAVDQTGYKDINEGFKADADQIEAARRALKLKPEFGAPITPSQENGLANLFMRRGQDTRTAGKEITPELATALEQYPELRRFLEAPELLQARGRMEFGLGGESVGGLREWVRSTIGRNIQPAKTRLLEPAVSGALGASPSAGTFFNRIREAAAEEERRRGSR